MENKLKELTDRLYGEGLEKGRSEAQTIVAEAKAEAAKILSEAEVKADAIVRQAEEKAADVAKNSATEIALAGKQAVAKIKEEIALAVIAKSADEALKGLALDGDFLASMLLEVARNWHADGSVADLKALLPAAKEAELSQRIGASAGELLKAGIEVGYSKDVRSGFKIGEKEGGYYISFSDESFSALMQEYLREKVSRLLFE